MRNTNDERHGRGVALLVLSGVFSLGGLIACETRAEAPPAPIKDIEAARAKPEDADPHRMGQGPSPHEPPPGQAGALPPAEVAWEKPEAWKDQPASMMRKASYRADGAAGPAEVAVFYFGPGQGGSVEDNIARWVSQFKDVPDGQVRRDQSEVNGFTAYTVRIASGTFSSGMPGGPTQPKEGWGLNAAIVETPSGAYFFKMTGPKQTVDAEEEAFKKLLASVKSKS